MTMRLLVCVALIVLCATPVWAEESAQESDYPAYQPGEAPAGDEAIYSLVSLDVLEAAPLTVGVPGELGGFWRLGNAFTSFWLKFEADGLIGDMQGEAEVLALYSRILTAFFDIQAGLRLDIEFEDDFRAGPQFVVGFEGLIPFLLEIEPALFVSLEGHVSARLKAHYNLYITQRLILQPAAEFNVAIQEVEDWGIGRGLNDIDLGARLRYEVIREFAPYMGITWTRRFGQTADFARADGESASEMRLVVGARIWW